MHIFSALAQGYKGVSISTWADVRLFKRRTPALIAQPLVKTLGAAQGGTRSSLVVRIWPGKTQRRVDLHEWTHTRQGWNGDSRVSHTLDW